MRTLAVFVTKEISQRRTLFRTFMKYAIGLGAVSASFPMVVCDCETNGGDSMRSGDSQRLVAFQ
jgi:hypothetical protein